MHAVVKHRAARAVAQCAVVALAVTTAVACSGGGGKGTAKQQSSSATSRGHGAADEDITGLSAAQIGERSLAQTKKASSVTLHMKRTKDGVAQTLNLALNGSGDCRGHITYDGARADVLKQRSDVYLKMSPEFWDSEADDGERISAFLGDKWIKTSTADDELSELVRACDIETVLDVPAMTLKGKSTTVDGQPAVSVTGKENGVTTTVYVAARDEPRLLKVVTEGGASPSTLTLTDYDRPVTITPPAAGQAVSLDDLVAG